MKPLVFLSLSVYVLSGCVSRQRDHFYTLDPQPAARESAASFVRQITVRVTVPSMVDRGEMVVTTADGVSVLDHERWGAPLADLVTTTLGQDLEGRRLQAVVVPQSSDHAGMPVSKIVVTIDEVTARMGEQVSVEAHWQLADSDGGNTIIDRAVFSAPAKAGYSGLAQALSDCIAQLADRLALAIPAKPASQ